MIVVIVALGGLLALAALVVVDRRRREAEVRVDQLEHDRSRIATAHAELAHVATHDAMTGLLNRGGLTSRLEGILAAATGPIGVMFMDIDRFKSNNDSLGHGAGDQ
ncbi:MAG: diguanylate cyclase domain-containing protein, partial [Actinomycetes bacterium]